MRSVCDVHSLIHETNTTETVSAARFGEEQTRGVKTFERRDQVGPNRQIRLLRGEVFLFVLFLQVGVVVVVVWWGAGRCLLPFSISSVCWMQHVLRRLFPLNMSSALCVLVV